eukprot:m.284402 g.284402  ORF g.284402 m.284402 type:complete len:310 (+) comp40679_c0_seq34:157-1086(+)
MENCFDIISNLPMELSLLIFSFFSIPDICLHISGVCRAWNELSQDPTLWRKLDLPQNANFHPDKLLAISGKLGGIRFLDISPQMAFSSRHFETVFPFLTSLNYLSVGFMDSFTSHCMRVVVKNCPRLEHINLEGCKYVSNACLHLLKELSLKSLNLSHCTQVDEEALVDLIHCQPCLTSLNIDGIPWTSMVTCDALKDHRLLALHLDGAEMEDDCLECVCYSQALTNFSVSFCDEMTDKGLLYLKGLKCLRSLRLKKGFKFTPYGLSSLFESWTGQAGALMVSLNLTECTGVKDDVMTVIADKLLTGVL